jgi:hypothetical protein
MNMKQPHQLFNTRRRTADGSPFTKKVAEARRWDLAAFVLKAIPPDEFLAIMQAPRPASIQELVQLAHERAAEILCPHCRKPLTLPTTTQESP